MKTIQLHILSHLPVLMEKHRGWWAINFQHCWFDFLLSSNFIVAVGILMFCCTWSQDQIKFQVYFLKVWLFLKCQRILIAVKWGWGEAVFWRAGQIWLLKFKALTGNSRYKSQKKHEPVTQKVYKKTSKFQKKRVCRELFSEWPLIPNCVGNRLGEIWVRSWKSPHLTLRWEYLNRHIET